MTNSNDIITQIEAAVFERPEVALDVPGWSRSGDKMQTRFRPDGSDSHRHDKMVLRYRDGGRGLFLTYNGASWCGGFVASILKRKYGPGWITTVARLYGIDTDSPHSFAPRREQARHTAQTPYTIGDEADVCEIPASIFSPTFDPSREDILRGYLSGVLREEAIGRAWGEYQVGTAFDGRTIFWLFDKQGRCRGGKMMAYRPDGHRDKENPFSILAVHSDLIRSGRLPEGWVFSDCLFGEHLLRCPEKTVGLVESEKTALVCSVAYPAGLWLATGGAKRNLDRAAALLAGRKVVAFPDADAHEAWRKKFAAVPGFSINSTCRDYALNNGEKWQKCDLADILVHEYLLAGKVAEIAQNLPKNRI